MTAVQQTYRQFFSQLPTGVTAIVGRSGERPVGMIVGSFASVSMDPPLVSFMVTTGSRAWAALKDVGRFTANILAADQRSVCETVAGWSFDKFEDIEFEDPGSTVIAGSLAWADCVIEREVEAGDHTIVLAAPVELTVERTTAPLVFSQRRYHRTLPIEDLRGPGWG